jgi:hypothetical protein
MHWFLRRCTYKSRTPSRIGSALPRGDARDGFERVILQDIDTLKLLRDAPVEEQETHPVVCSEVVDLFVPAR